MNDMLEKKIREQAETVFNSEPGAGHRERFAGKLAARRKRRTAIFRSLAVCTGVAAAFLVAVLLIKTVFQPGDSREEESFDEVRNYYGMLLEDEIESTEQLLSTVDDCYRESIRKDIEFIRTDTFFPENGEQNKFLLVSMYSSKIEALQHIQNILSEHFNYNSKTEQI
jgi:hypothetical protein